MKHAAGVGMHVDNCLGFFFLMLLFLHIKFFAITRDTLWSPGVGADEDHMARASLDWFIILIIIILILLIILIIACIVLRSRGDTYPGQRVTLSVYVAASKILFHAEVNFFQQRERLISHMHNRV